MEQRLTQVESAIRGLERQREEDREDATRDNDRRHEELMSAVGRVESQLLAMNGTVRQNRERIVRVETHQQRSKEDKDRAAKISSPAIAVAQQPKIRSEIQWAAIGGILLVALQNLSEAILVVVRLLSGAQVG